MMRGRRAGLPPPAVALFLLLAWVGRSQAGAHAAAAVSPPKPPAPQPAVLTVRLDLEGEWSAQFDSLKAQIAALPRQAQRVEETAYNRSALVLPRDRDPADVVIRRTEALVANLAGSCRRDGGGATAGRDAGGTAGRDAGVTAGRDAGATASRDAGATAGRDAGVTAGRDAGGTAGRDAGGTAGRDAGVTKALEQLKAHSLSVPLTDPVGRYNLFRDACKLRRKIALSNPLLDFDKILFVKRNRSTYNHMCDQFFGHKAAPGGGICVLTNAFGDAPVVRSVLAESVVQSGRLKGRKLEGGAFLSPDLSYDGKQVLFAYCECQGAGWTPECCWHIFKVNVDGGGLQQLTDGPWNDFDPCWLPNGRVAFVSERRGGYGRCHGRPVPSYTLHAMNADGGEMVTLSFHETNEWQPSVTHEGLIVYTRWDYVDRDSNCAHHPWVTTPDGRDARALHGNFPLPNGLLLHPLAPGERPPDGRRLRPWLEMDIRAIPGSPKYVGTAAAHHGQAYGSLVILDAGLEDDDALSQLKRLTPEVLFPEAEGGAEVYGTAWPLSEDFFLCVYRHPASGKPDRKQAPPPPPEDPEAGTVEAYDPKRPNYGLYLLDSFGNKELLYRDLAFGCREPMPLKPRPAPPVIPAVGPGMLAKPMAVVAGPNPGMAAPAGHGPAAAPQGVKAAAPEATVAVMNVYDALLPWPKDTKIKALRIVQLLPKATARADSPPVGIGRQSLCRGVLGTVPVEEDGSAQFYCPAGKAIYFQALDERGLAVQSMRSDTYVQPGQFLTCQGCHDPRAGGVRAGGRAVSALRRPPSRIKPDVDGSYPLAFPRLVQGVLDRNCVACHQKNSAAAPSLAGTPHPKRQVWTCSYVSLSPKGYYLQGGRGGIMAGVHGGSRSVPGEVGACASDLYKMLAAGHHDVKLAPPDLHRLTLWLDCNSVFYGAYTRTEEQIKGEFVPPDLE